MTQGYKEPVQQTGAKVWEKDFENLQKGMLIIVNDSKNKSYLAKVTEIVSKESQPSKSTVTVEMANGVSKTYTQGEIRFVRMGYEDDSKMYDIHTSKGNNTYKDIDIQTADMSGNMLYCNYKEGTTTYKAEIEINNIDYVTVNKTKIYLDSSLANITPVPVPVPIKKNWETDIRQLKVDDIIVMQDSQGYNFLATVTNKDVRNNTVNVDIGSYIDKAFGSTTFGLGEMKFIKLSEKLKQGRAAYDGPVCNITEDNGTPYTGKIIGAHFPLSLVVKDKVTLDDGSSVNVRDIENIVINGESIVLNTYPRGITNMYP